MEKVFVSAKHNWQNTVGINGEERFNDERYEAQRIIYEVNEQMVQEGLGILV